VDDAGSDLRDMGTKILRTRALDRTKWESVMSEAKAKLKGSWCSKIRKRKKGNLSIK
jgi:hypothetical protein